MPVLLPLGLLVVLCLWGCEKQSDTVSLTVPPPIIPIAAGPYPEQPADPAWLNMVFLGAGGVHLQNAGQSVLADPFFSNPPIKDWILLRDLVVREDVIDRYLPATNDLDAILVAHAHHDHAMDVPYIAAQVDSTVKVYGSETLRNSLLSVIDPGRLVALNGQAGHWVAINDSLRIMPLLSGHAPHLLGRVFNSDRITQPLAQSPRTVMDWQSGQTLSFVLDFLASGQTRFRVYYQSSAADPMEGYPPHGLPEDGKPVDLALLGVANHNRLQDYPVSLLRVLQPRQVVLLHWDVFWDDYSQTVTQPAPGLDLKALVRKIETVLPADVPVYLPGRGAVLSLQESL
ncbi:MAG: hypothetical protein CSH49_11490 [Alcanivorax sp.]|nr:MAG: hypothetical protein CSH49_11490 [Alcanivorax sp.]